MTLCNDHLTADPTFHQKRQDPLWKRKFSVDLGRCRSHPWVVTMFFSHYFYDHWIAPRSVQRIGHEGGFPFHAVTTEICAHTEDVYTKDNLKDATHNASKYVDDLRVTSQRHTGNVQTQHMKLTRNATGNLNLRWTLSLSFLLLALCSLKQTQVSLASKHFLAFRYYNSRCWGRPPWPPTRLTCPRRDFSTWLLSYAFYIIP